jgi:DNA invertase Pin-like site-specific DNA recombinase
MKPAKRVAIYARVSTDGQTVENQVRELRAVARKEGWTIVQEFIDKGISGAKGIEDRPGFKALHQGITRRDFEVVMAWSVDRLGRSLQHLVTFLSEIHAKHCDLYLHKQGVDTSTPAGKMLFQMLGVFAEFERTMIQERVKSGLARAVAQGVQLGRPTVGAKKEAEVASLRASGMGIKSIAKKAGVGVGTVKRIIDARKKAA